MRKVLLYVGFVGIVVSVLVMAICSAFGGRGSSVAEEQVSVNVPEGVAVPVSDSKTEAYRNTHISTDQYFAQLSAEEDISLVSSDEDRGNEEPLSAGEDEEAAAKRVSGDSEVASVSIAVERSPVKPVMTGSSGYGQMTPEQKLEYDRRRAEMVRDVMTEGEITAQAGNDDDDRPRLEELSLNDIASVYDGIITSLDDDFDDPSVRYSSSAKVPFRCMFVRDQKVVDGQRVTVRLLEDYSADGVFVPANTHLAAVCKVSDRLELSVRSIEIN